MGSNPSNHHYYMHLKIIPLTQITKRGGGGGGGSIYYIKKGGATLSNWEYTKGFRGRKKIEAPYSLKTCHSTISSQFLKMLNTKIFTLNLRMQEQRIITIREAPTPHIRQTHN
jgi:hypothetical protein